MKIGEVATQAGCDVQTVRFYEREGLLKTPERDGSGYRRYSAEHLRQLHFIRHCRALDMPLAEVRQLQDFAANPQPSCSSVNDLLDTQIEQIRQRLASLQRLEGQLVTLRGQCDGNQQTRSCAVIEAFMHAPPQDAVSRHARGTATP